MKRQNEVKSLLCTSLETLSQSLSIFLVTPGSRVTLFDENASKYEQPGVASIETQAKEINFLNLALFSLPLKIILTKSSQKLFTILKFPKIELNKIILLFKKNQLFQLYYVFYKLFLIYSHDTHDL